MKADSAVLCFGALHYDCIADCIGPYRQRASNPVRTHRTPGGVGHNIARNLTQFGLQVGMSSLVGSDDDGINLMRVLEDYGIDGSLVRQTKKHASASYIAVLEESGELAVGLADMAIYDAMDIPMMKAILKEALAWKNWIIDANLPQESIEWLARNKTDQTLYLAPVSVAKAPRVKPILDLADVLICNEYEIEILSANEVNSPAAAAHAAESLISNPHQVFVVTLGAKGAVLVSQGERLHFPAPPTKVVDVNGAGDSFFSGFVAAHVNGATPKECVRNGLAKASITAETSNPVDPSFTMEVLENRKQLVPDEFPV